MPFAVPFAAPDALVGLPQLVKQGQQHAQGVFAHGIPVAFRAVEDADATAGGGIEVDVFEARPRSADEAQRGQLAQKGVVDANAAPQDDAGGVSVSVHAFHGWGAGGVDAGHASRAEALGKQGVDGVQKQDLHAPTDMSTPIPK